MTLDVISNNHMLPWMLSPCMLSPMWYLRSYLHTTATDDPYHHSSNEKEFNLFLAIATIKN
jgi:hypothetical protein